MINLLSQMALPEQDKIFDATITLIAASIQNGKVTLDNGVDVNKRNWMRDCVETAVKAYLHTHPTTKE